LTTIVLGYTFTVIVKQICMYWLQALNYYTYTQTHTFNKDVIMVEIFVYFKNPRLFTIHGCCTIMQQRLLFHF